MLEKYFDLTNTELRSFDKIDFYPKAKDREKWECLPSDIKESFVEEAQKYLNYQYPSMLAANYTKLYTEDSRDPYMKPYFSRRTVLSKLVIAECIEHKGRFMTDIINGIYLICEETTWIDPAHSLVDYAVNDGARDILPNKSSRFIDLFAGSTGVLMAWTYYLLKDELDEVSPLICECIRFTLDERIIAPYLECDDFWWLTCSNNWNPHMNSVVAKTASIIVEDEPKLRKIFEKAIKSIDCYFCNVPQDGGCEEGPKYWHADLADEFLEWVRYVTYGKIDIFKEPLLQKITDYEVNMYVGKNNYASVSDSHMNFEKEQSAKLFKIGEFTNNENIKIMAAERGKECKTGYDTLSAMLEGLFRDIDDKEFEKYSKKSVVFKKNFWYDSIQTAIWREKDSCGGLYFMIYGGNNEFHHNHNDVGNFFVFNDCEPVIIDAGIGVYSNTAFSPNRYTLNFMNSKYHNVPYIGGVEQKAGKEYKAVDVEAKEDWVSMDIAPAYGDESILKWKRTVEYDRASNRILFTEDYEFTDEKEISLHFLLCDSPDITDGCAVLSNGVRLEYDGLCGEYEEVCDTDEVMKKNWGRIFRLKLKTKGKSGKISYTLSADD